MKLEVGTVYHCNTEEDAIELLLKLHELGYKWRNGASLLKYNYWTWYKNKTCYLILEDKKITFAGINTYVYMISNNKLDGEIIEYEKQPIIDMHIKHQVLYENLIRLIEALDITVEDSDIYDDREMLVVPKKTIHDEELIEIYRRVLEKNE